MRDLSKAMIRFSWAMPLFGFQQFMNILNLGNPNGPMDQTTDSLNAVTEAAAAQFGSLMGATFRSGDAIQGQLVDALLGNVSRGTPTRPSATPTGSAPYYPPPPSYQPPPGIMTRYKADPSREIVLARYTRGSGKFSQDKKFIALRMKLYTLDGREDGYHEGVWEAQFNRPEELLARPAPPQGPMNEPRGPVPHAPVMAQTKAHWVFGDNSSVTVAGPAASHLIPLRDGSFLFLVSTAQIITSGTGRFAGAYGLVQSLGSTHVPAGVNLFGSEDVSFTASTMDTFKIVPGRYYASPDTASSGTRPPATTRAPDSPSPDYPFEPHYATVRGSKMHYIDEGKGDPILFLHGNPAWSYLWRNVIPHLTSSGRCIAPDLIGMGRSSKPEIEYSFFDQFDYLEDFIKKLGLRKITLVLHDWGTALGFHYAMRNHEKVKGIAFMEALVKPYSSWEDFPASLRDTFRAFRDPKKGRELIIENNVMIEQVLPGSVMRKLSETEMNYYREPFRTQRDRLPIMAFINELPVGGVPGAIASLVSNYCEKLKRSSIPKLLIYADPGAITTAPDVEWCRNNLPNLKTVSIGPGIHFHQEDNPDGVGREIASWLATIRSGRSE
jgi:haloalkane dehalogenase